MHTRAQLEDVLCLLGELGHLGLVHPLPLRQLRGEGGRYDLLQQHGRVVLPNLQVLGGMKHRNGAREEHEGKAKGPPGAGNMPGRSWGHVRSTGTNPETSFPADIRPLLAQQWGLQYTQVL